MGIALLETFEKCLGIFLIENIVQAGNRYFNYTAQKAEARGSASDTIKSLSLIIRIVVIVRVKRFLKMA